MSTYQKRTHLFATVGLTALLLLAACADNTPAGAEEPAEGEHDEEAGDIDEHDEDEDAEHEDEDAEHEDEEAEHEDDEHAHVEAPDEFADLTNPLSGDAEATTVGEALFQTNCATCHGETGEGDGPAAAGLDPAPASLADSAMMSDLTDGYLFWRISEGGAHDPFNSAMPAWQGTLSEDEIWQVISYVRTLSE
jgi:cytochrome c553